MRLTEASVAIRPRSPLEAMDLGVLLARSHAGLLMGAWALLTLPLFALLSLLLWDSPGWSILIFWWLKPAYERLPLHILSRALFGETPTLGQAFRALPGALRPALLASLTWHRFSPTRSFELPIVQLEGGDDRARQQRLAVLASQSGDRGAGLLTLVGMHVELALWLGLMSLLYLLVPQQTGLEFDWQKLLATSGAEWRWLEHLSNLLYALVLTLWEPVYVACGFSLYLNRRTQLEGWDIELAFRRLRQRLATAAAVVPLVLALALSPLSGETWAQVPDAAMPVPSAQRQEQQSLSSETARQDVRALLAQPPFTQKETVTRWRFGDPSSKKDADSTDWLRRFDALRALWTSLRWLPDLIEILLWSGIVCLLVLLAWRYRDWLSVFAGRLPRTSRRQRPAPEVLLGLQVAPHSLPDDIAGEAERLWPEQPRQALALLYRGLLSRLLHDFRLPLKEADTEGEVLARVRQLHQTDLECFAEQLTRHWANLAYGHRLPPEQARVELCAAWRRQFGPETRA